MATFLCRVILLDGSIIERDLEVSSQTQYLPSNRSVNSLHFYGLSSIFYVSVFIEKSSGPGSV